MMKACPVKLCLSAKLGENSTEGHLPLGMSAKALTHSQETAAMEWFCKLMDNR
jgi:hypothetical protein